MSQTTTQSPRIDPSVDPFAYRCSIEWQGDALLQSAFGGNFDRYLAYRRELREEKPDAGKFLPIEATTRTAWLLDPDLRTEFCDSYATCLAYHRAKAAGKARIVGGGTVTSMRRPS